MGSGRPTVHDDPWDARVRVQRVLKPGGTEIRIWRAHERVSVKRASAADEDSRLTVQVRFDDRFTGAPHQGPAR